MSDAPISLLPLGAILQSLTVASQNVVQGFPTQADYEAHNGPFFGETIGRVANRISNARLDSLNAGKSYALAANNGPNNLHGGVVGWGKRVWEGPKPVGIRKIVGVKHDDGENGDVEGEAVKFTLVSEDGDEGFPGTVEASAVYTGAMQRVGGREVTVVEIEYSAVLVGDVDETVINMTNHS